MRPRAQPGAGWAALERLTAAASAGVALLTLHTLVNLCLLRRPPRTGTPSGRATSGPASARPRVSVLIPCRDEASRIGPTLAAVLAAAPADAEILVLDDGSTDGTGAVVRAAAGDDRRVRMLEGRPLPSGWLGKPHACAQLAEAATGDVLVFLDADVRLEPGAVAATLALLEDSGLDLISPYPRQVAEGAGQRLVQPLLQWSWLTFLPLRLAERGPASMTAANGQLLACRASAYRAAGGHEAVRDRVIEDVELAKAFKAAGFGASVADGTDLATCRMYDGWDDLVAGYTKSLWAAFPTRARAGAAAAGLAWLYVLPPAGAVVGALGRRRRVLRLGALGYAAGVAGRAICARATGGRPVDGLAHPASIALFGWLTARSWHHHRRGLGTWKGRPVTPAVRVPRG